MLLGDVAGVGVGLARRGDRAQEGPDRGPVVGGGVTDQHGCQDRRHAHPPHTRRAVRRPPRLPEPPRYADVPDGDGGTAADGVGRGRARRRSGRAAAARRADLVVPVPHDDPGAGRRRAAGRGAGPRRLRPLRQAGRDRPTTPTPGTSSGCARCVFDVLDLRAVTLVGQDWGGLIGLRLVAEHPDRFARVVAANTGLPTGDRDMPAVWWRFRRAVETAEVLDVARLVQSGCRTPLTPRCSPPTTPRSPTSRTRPARGHADARADPARRPGDRSQPRRLGRAAPAGHAVPLRVQRRRPDHRPDGAAAARRCPGPRAASTRRSPAPGTSCRRTPGRSWPRRWRGSSGCPASLPGMDVRVVDHPLAKARLSTMRDARTDNATFRAALQRAHRHARLRGHARRPGGHRAAAHPGRAHHRLPAGQPAAAGAGAAGRARHGRRRAGADAGRADGLRRPRARRGDAAADAVHGVAARVARRAPGVRARPDARDRRLDGATRSGC